MVVADNSVVAMDDNGHLHCMDLATGALRWHKDLDAETPGRPAAAHHLVLVATPDRIIRLDIASGAAQAPIVNPGEPWAGGPLVVGRRLAVPVASGAIQVLDGDSSECLYRLDGSKRGGRVFATGDYLFVVQADRRVHCFRALR